MKITEPKTPFVRYNVETDTIEGGMYSVFCFTNTSSMKSTADIPDLNLGVQYMYDSPPPRSPARTVSSTGADTSGYSSRRTSISSVGFFTGNNNNVSNSSVAPSGSVSGASLRSAGSGSSSRSTSFNLPDEARRGIRAADGDRREEVEEDEEMDEESESEYTFDKMNCPNSLFQSRRETCRVPQSQGKALFKRGRGHEGISFYQESILVIIVSLPSVPHSLWTKRMKKTNRETPWMLAVTMGMKKITKDIPVLCLQFHYSRQV